MSAASNVVPLQAAVPHRAHMGMAQRLAQREKGQLLHVQKLGWYAWDGMRWARDETGRAKLAVMAMVGDCLRSKDQELVKDARKCETSGAVAGILDLAEPMLAALATDLDADPYLLNVANGTLDLRDGTLHPHDPRNLCTRITRAAYRPQGEQAHGLWDQFLEQVQPEQDMREFMQRVIGVALLGKVTEHVLPIWTGTGANGKSVAHTAIMHALGDYAAPADPELFTSKEGAHPTGQMDLMGRRFVVVSENDRGRKLSEGTMKRLTGGEPIKARYMGRDFIEFVPSHLAVLVTNFLPEASGNDLAVWRRLRVVPFDVVIPEDQRDPLLGERLELQADAVLAWAVEGLLDYHRRGYRLDEPAKVMAATRRYQQDSDAVGRFVVEACHLSRGVQSTTKDLYAAWEAWSVVDGCERLTERKLGKELDRLGYPTSAPSNGKRWRQGIVPARTEDDWR